MVVETLCPARAFRKGRGGRTSVRSKFGWRREARKDVAGSKTAAPSAPSFVPIVAEAPAVRTMALDLKAPTKRATLGFR